MLRLLSNLVLTRLLFPEAFGMMALVQVFLAGFQMFSDFGIRTSILQNPRGDEEDFLNTAWTLQIARGVLLWLLACAAAGPAAAFYGEEMLASILPVAGLTPLINGFTPTKIATAHRHLVLGRLVQANLISQTLAIVATIALAAMTGSVWALVYGGLIGSVLSVLTAQLMLPGIRNRLHWEWTAARDMFHFGKYLFFSTIAGFVISQGDRALLGKFVSLSDLAIYNIAFFFANVPLLLNQRLTNNIFLPLCRNRPSIDSAENRAKIRRARMILTAGTFATALPLALAGDLLIRFMYDPRYHAAGPILVLLSLSFLVPNITRPYGTQLLAIGDSRSFLILTVSLALARITLLYFLVVRFGMLGIILAPAVSELLVYPVLVRIARRYRSWDPLHDAVFLLAVIAIAVPAIWLNLEAVQAFVAP